jgi:hypothetical protein
MKAWSPRSDKSMWNEKRFDRAVEKLPKLYANENIPSEEQIVRMHLFISGTDWWITEGEAKEGVLFGYCCLNGDWMNSEWGYVSIEELKSIRIGTEVNDAKTGKKISAFDVQVDYDMHWDPKAFKDIEEIKKGKAALFDPDSIEGQKELIMIAPTTGEEKPNFLTKEVFRDPMIKACQACKDPCPKKAGFCKEALDELNRQTKEVSSFKEVVGNEQYNLMKEKGFLREDLGASVTLTTPDMLYARDYPEWKDGKY